MSALLSNTLRFAPMRVADLDEVVAAEATLYDFPWLHTNFSDSLDAGYSAWVVRRDGALAAYAVMMLVLDEAHLLNLSVQRAFQRQGCGTALLGYLFQVGRNFGAGRMYLEVRPSNAAGRGLYARCGFAQIGIRRGYYPAASGREDALVMSVDL